MANITSTDKIITLTGLSAFKAKMLEQISTSAYDDTEIRGLITANTNKINTLNGSSTTSGSVDYKIAQAKNQITQQINSAVSSVYKPKGSIAFASLPALTSAVVGDVYNVTDAFTSTADFVDGAGKKYPASTNVVCVDISGAKKWDALSGVTDLSAYCTTATVDSKITTAKSAAISESKTYADTKDASTLSSAKAYTDTEAAKCVKYTDVTLATTAEVEALFS